MTVPLSEEEQRVLEDIERRLHEEDPSFARQVGSPSTRSTGRRLNLGLLLFVAGLAVLFAFFVTRSIPVGVLAFGAMVAGIVMAAGAIGSLAADRDGRKQRLSAAFEDWEARIRRRGRRS
jgi:uncharacterized membrane protein HdeD (DUF308 family)